MFRAHMRGEEAGDIDKECTPSRPWAVSSGSNSRQEVESGIDAERAFLSRNVESASTRFKCKKWDPNFLNNTENVTLSKMDRFEERIAT